VKFTKPVVACSEDRTTRVLVLTHSEQNASLKRSSLSRLRLHPQERAPPESMINAVRATAAGESVLSSQIFGRLLQHIHELDLPRQDQ
jgi:DNA-binding NarL/FixJ family response regulator